MNCKNCKKEIILKEEHKDQLIANKEHMEYRYDCGLTTVIFIKDTEEETEKIDGKEVNKIDKT